MKILLTGGAGFIGFHTANALLKKGDSVVIVDNFNDYYDPALKEARINELENNLGITAEKNMMPMQPGDVPATMADISKAKKMLGYSPKVSVPEGVKMFVAWYREYYTHNS